ncbi:MAG: hypothetical protein U0232_12865 [Thermomicrobiales bacterium]
MPDLPPETREALLGLLPPFANPLNPLDITASGWGNRAIYSEVAARTAATPGVDLVACIGDTTRHSGPLDARRAGDKMIAGLADARERTDKPIALINTLTDVADALTDALAERGVIQLSGARVAARAIGHAGRYARWRQGTRPAQVGAAVDTARRTRALALPCRRRERRRRGVGQQGLASLLRHPVPPGGTARSADEAARAGQHSRLPGRAEDRGRWRPPRDRDWRRRAGDRIG